MVTARRFSLVLTLLGVFTLFSTFRLAASFKIAIMVRVKYSLSMKIWKGKINFFFAALKTRIWKIYDKVILSEKITKMPLI